MASYGRSVVANIGTSIRVSADGRPEVKIGGVTIDWTTVVAAAAAATLSDGVAILAGDLYLRYGQVITKITTVGVSVVTVDATSGTFTITVASEVNGTTITATTAAIAEAATAGAVQTALRLLTTIPGYASIAVAGNAGGPFTITFLADSGYVVVTATSIDLAGGTGVTVAVTGTGGNVDKYGPYDPLATDGRQTLTPGSVYILDRTVKFNDLYSDHPPGVLYGGMLFQARVLQSGVAAHTLAAGPTLAEVNTAFPRIQWVTEAPAGG